MNESLFLSVVIPAYNEKVRLPQTLEEIRPYLDAKKWPYEVLIVDDGSADETVQICQEAARAWPQLKCLSGFGHAGKGACVKRGALAALGEKILIMDADHATPINTLDWMEPHLNLFDMICGVRTFAGEEGASGKGRRVIGLIQQLMAHLIVFKNSVADSQCGFKLFSRDCAKEIFSRSRVQGGMYDVELFLIAQNLKLRIYSLPVKWVNKEGSRINIPRCMIFDPLDLVKIRCRDLWGQYR